MAEESTVYLEDIESQRDASVASTTSQSTVTSSSVSVGAKRQRTLMDMFSGSQPDKPSAPTAKKLKLSASEPALPVKTSTASSSKNLRLNAIPFSMTQYQESLATDQRNLLALECAYMGKSWYATADDSYRLENRNTII
jgi:uracil-DNA glycosylase